MQTSFLHLCFSFPSCPKGVGSLIHRLDLLLSIYLFTAIPFLLKGNASFLSVPKFSCMPERLATRMISDHLCIHLSISMPNHPTQPDKVVRPIPEARNLDTVHFSLTIPFQSKVPSYAACVLPSLLS